MTPVPYFQYYIDLNTEQDILSCLKKGLSDTLELLSDVPESKAHYAYEEGKWTIAQLVQHLIDTERIFQYRALTISRETNPDIVGFDHDEYACMAPAVHLSLDFLIKQFSLLRASTIHMYEAFLAEELGKKGKANDIEISVEQLGFVIPGHVNHHLKILKERYL